MNLSRRLFLKGTAAVAAVPVALTGIAFAPTPAEAIPVLPDLKPNSDSFIVYYHDLWHEAELQRVLNKSVDKNYRGDSIDRSREMYALLYKKRAKNPGKSMTLVIDDRIMPMKSMSVYGGKLPHAISYTPSVIIRVHVDGSVQFLKDRFHNRAAVSRKAQ